MRSNTRISTIIERINNGEELSITQLAEEFQSSTKSIQRDFKDIEELLPGLIERASDGKKFKKKLKQFASNESEVILEILDSMAKDVGTGFYSKAHPLLKQLKDQIERPFYMRIDLEDISKDLSNVQLIEKAIEAKQQISFEYKPLYEDKAKAYNSVGALKLVAFNGFWYLLCEHLGYVKKFYLKGIKNIQELKTKFTPSPDVIDRMENSVNVWFNPSVKPYEVVLDVDEPIVVYLERKALYPNQKLYKRPDGSAEVVIKITSKEELFPILKYWIPHIRVEKPEHLQVEFESLLKTYFI